MHTVRKDYDEAEGLYRKALELDPNDVQRMNGLGWFLTAIRKRYDEAEPLLRRAGRVQMYAGGSKCAFWVPNVRFVAGKPYIWTLLRDRGMTARYAGAVARYRGMSARYRGMVPRYRGTVARCAGGVPWRANGPPFVPSELRTVRWSPPTVPWNHSTVPCDGCSVPRNHRSVPCNHSQECSFRRAMRLSRRRVPRGRAAACPGIPLAWPGKGTWRDEPDGAKDRAQACRKGTRCKSGRPLRLEPFRKKCSRFPSSKFRVPSSEFSPPRRCANQK
jgi:hypothetical protein